MPSHRCPSCGALVTGRCPTCVRRRDQARPAANRRGYCSTAWRAFRAAQLAAHPLCAICSISKLITPATCVDHIQPVTGPADPRFLDVRAVQSLCSRCHSAKTAREDSGFLTHQRVTP